MASATIYTAVVRVLLITKVQDFTIRKGNKPATYAAVVKSHTTICSQGREVIIVVNGGGNGEINTGLTPDVTT